MNKSSSINSGADLLHYLSISCKTNLSSAEYVKLKVGKFIRGISKNSFSVKTT